MRGCSKLANSPLDSTGAAIAWVESKSILAFAGFIASNGHRLTQRKAYKSNKFLTLTVPKTLHPV
jgi:hypothetical protein